MKSFFQRIGKMNFSDDEIDAILTQQENNELTSLISSLDLKCNTTKLMESFNSIVQLMRACDKEDLEEKVWIQFMPFMKSFISKMYTVNVKVSNLEDLKINLQTSLNVLKYLNEILEFCTESSLDFQFVRSIPMNVAIILSSSFQHCKDSRDIYKSNFHSLEEIIQLFHRTQEMHTKYFKFLNSIDFSDCLRTDPTTFRQILDAICEIGQILSGMNVKSVVENWKGYVALIQKYSSNIDQNRLNLKIPLQCLKQEMQKSLTQLLNDDCDTNLSIQHVKLSGFLLKVGLKLVTILSDYFLNNYTDALDFAFTVYAFPIGFFIYSQYSEQILQLIDQQINRPVDDFLDDYLKHNMFFVGVNLIFNDNYYGSLKCLVKFLLMMNNNIVKQNELFMNILRQIFVCVEKVESHFILDCNPNSFYEELLININRNMHFATNIYEDIEMLLLKKVLQDKTLPALLAINVWCLFLKTSQGPLTIETLDGLIKLCKQIDPLQYSPEILHLHCLMGEIYHLLPVDSRADVLSRYEPLKNLDVWTALGFDNLPISQRFYIEGILHKIYDSIELFENRTLKVDGFLVLINCIGAMSTVDFDRLQLDCFRMTSTIVKLWRCGMNETTIKYRLYNKFISNLCKLTKNLVGKFENRDLMNILKRLKSLAESHAELMVCNVLHAIPEKGNTNLEQKRIIRDILEYCLQDKTGIIAGLAADLLDKFGESIPCGRFIGENPHQKKFELDFFTHPSHNHECFAKLPIENCDKDEEVPCKRPKLDDIDEVIDELKSVVKKLKKCTDKTALTKKQVGKINAVANALATL